jgi:hypothetical protein
MQKTHVKDWNLTDGRQCQETVYTQIQDTRDSCESKSSVVTEKIGIIVDLVTTLSSSTTFSHLIRGTVRGDANREPVPLDRIPGGSPVVARP